MNKKYRKAIIAGNWKMNMREGLGLFAAVQVVDVDEIAVPREGAGDRLADAAGRAGDKRCFHRLHSCRSYLPPRAGKRTERQGYCTTDVNELRIFCRFSKRILKNAVSLC